jgi:hypothetical protein
LSDHALLRSCGVAELATGVHTVSEGLNSQLSRAEKVKTLGFYGRGSVQRFVRAHAPAIQCSSIEAMSACKDLIQESYSRYALF